MRTINPTQIENRLENYYLPLFHFAERLCGSPTRAILLTQRTVKLALDRSQNLPVPTNMRAWLFTLLFRQFLETRPHHQHA